MIQRVTDGRFDKAYVRTAVEACATETIGMNRMLRQQRRDAIGQLDFPARTRRGVFKQIKNAG